MSLAAWNMASLSIGRFVVGVSSSLVMTSDPTLSCAVTQIGLTALAFSSFRVAHAHGVCAEHAPDVAAALGHAPR